MSDNLNLPPPDGEGQRPAEAPRRRQPRQEADPFAILEGTMYADLPDVFFMQDQNGTVQEREPVYICDADCFLGLGREVTLYEEGSLVVTDATPNQHMRPLNRRAGVMFLTWLGHLPESRAPIDVGDMAEAAQMLAHDPDRLKLNKIEWQRAVTSMAQELKLKRMDAQAMELPSFGHNFTRGPAKSIAPPLLNAKLAELGARHPGETRFAESMPYTAPRGPATRRAQTAPMGGPAFR